MTGWEERDRGNDSEVRGMAVGVREGSGIGDCGGMELRLRR